MKKAFAVIFDMDGTLLDNAEYHKKAWIKFLEKHGIEITAEEYHKKLFGRTSKEIMSIVFDRDLSDEEKTKFTEEKEKTYRDHFGDMLSPQQGLLDLLHELKENEIKLAVATSATEANLKFTLEQLAIEDFFLTTTNSSEISRSKPHPEIFLKTAADLGVEAERCLVFEDSPPGVEAAHKAGMRVIVVNPSEKEKIIRYTDHIFEDFNPLNYSRIVSIMNQ